MIKIAKAISSLNPKAAFSIENNDYSTVQWTDSHEGIKPTIEEVQAELARLEAEAPNKEAEKNRLRSYQKESDPLFFKWQAGEATQEEWVAKRNEIRARYPKSN
jgi:hypothetical protein